LLLRGHRLQPCILTGRLSEPAKSANAPIALAAGRHLDARHDGSGGIDFKNEKRILGRDLRRQRCEQP
jgi:hypothetical protein